MELKDIINAIISEIDMGKACQLRNDSYEGCEMNTDSVLELEPFIKDFNDLVTVIKKLRDKYPIID